MSSERPEVQRYKQSTNFYERFARSTEIVASVADSIPIVILPGGGLVDAKVTKLVIAKSSKASTLIHRMRQQLYLSQTQGIFLYLADGTLLQRDMVLGELYEAKKADDNFLYLVVATQEELGL
jgi:hypothetical protein